MAMCTKCGVITHDSDAKDHVCEEGSYPEPGMVLLKGSNTPIPTPAVMSKKALEQMKG